MREKATRNSPVPATNGLVSLFLVEGVIIVLLSLATYVLLALLSYSSGDPGWSGTGENAAVVNWVGRSGAWLADVLFFLFGGLAYLCRCFWSSGQRVCTVDVWGPAMSSGTSSVCVEQVSS